MQCLLGRTLVLTELSGISICTQSSLASDTYVHWVIRTRVIGAFFWCLGPLRKHF
jgi:hypothetical protein